MVVDAAALKQCTKRSLKPHTFGYMKIIQTSRIPQDELSNPYFFILDGLPSQTNVDQNEPETEKDRLYDHLVPTLCCFDGQEQFIEFLGKIKKQPTRSAHFQMIFAQYAKATFPLDRYAVDISVKMCLNKLSALLSKKCRLPKSELIALGRIGDCDILCCGDSEIHKFSVGMSICEMRVDCQT